MKTPRERYQNNAQYKALVDSMITYISDCHFTASEMREAAVLASIIYEEHQISLNPLLTENMEVEKALSTIRNWIKGE